MGAITERNGDEFIIREPERVVWLASYPSSGNALARGILWQYFGVPSTSVYRYPEYPPPIGEIIGERPNARVIKIHQETPPVDGQIIYVVRDRDQVIKSGRRRWGNSRPVVGGLWVDHVADYLLANNTRVILEFDRLVNDREHVVHQLSVLFDPLPDVDERVVSERLEQIRGHYHK